MPFATMLRLLAIFGVFLLSSCSMTTTDTHVNDQNANEHEEPDAGGDADPTNDADVINDTDPDPPATGSESVSGANIDGVGSDGFLLRGTVLTGDEVIDDGEVLIEDELITCVGPDCSAESAGLDLTTIETDGVISPGLIDAHNHLPYNFLPPWIPVGETIFDNRYQWADDPAYRAHIAPYGDNRNLGTHYCPAAKWGEMRSVIHGTTTVQGQSFQQRCVDWAVRNADHYNGLQHNHLRTTIGSPRTLTDDQVDSYIASFERDDNPTTRFAVHMTEGVQGSGIEEEFDAFADFSLLDYGTAVLIHSIALNSAQLETVAMTDSRIVWSPSSNFALYGAGVTAPIEEILEKDITTAIGPDWTVSGTYDMPAEMRVAFDHGESEGIDLLTPERIWRMATVDGAETVGLHEFIGRIEPGYHADITIFGRHSSDPYRAVLDSRAEDMELVMVGGDVYFGDAQLQDAGRNDHCQAFDACGNDKFICVQDGPNADDRGDERLEDVRAQLLAILEGLEGAPEEEQYDRADELLELVICGI